MGKKLTAEIFIERATAIHGALYVYSEVKYVNSCTPVEIICQIHGSWLQTPSNHLRGKGCKKCASALQTSNTEIFVQKAKALHGDKYNYSKVKYVRADVNVEIICPVHHIFTQTPDAHLHSNGCYKCGRESCGNSTVNDTNYFVTKATLIHNNKYDYSKVRYEKNREEVIIICPIHGEFSQMAMAHLAGKGCKSCTMSISHKETKWLDSLGIPKENRNITLFIGDFWIKPDGFDPVTNTIYEFYGDYWHGNPKVYDAVKVNDHNGKTFGELYQQTLSRENMIKTAGYNLVTVWQYDFEATVKHE